MNRIALCTLLISAVGCAAAVKPVASTRPASSQSVVDAPLAAALQRQLQTMTRTHYQHQTRVDRSAGVYCYDCVGLVYDTLRYATPVAWRSIVEAAALPRGRIPGPARYRAFFANLHQSPLQGWQAVDKVADLRRGDVVAWERKLEFSTGHALVLAEDPVREADGVWWAAVYDASSSAHTDDTRPNDPRAEVLERTSRRSGLGRGVMGIIADPATGGLTGFRWSRKAKPVTAPIAAARPIE
jgi:hypothetical protein